MASEIPVKWSVNSCYFTETATIVNMTTTKVTKDTVTISGLDLTGYTVQLKDADPNELQLFIDKMPAPIKGKSVKYNSSKLCLSFGFGIKRYIYGWTSVQMYGNRQMKINMVRVAIVILVLFCYFFLNQN